jgi:iron complex outermembrane receptor protein
MPLTFNALGERMMTNHRGSDRRILLGGVAWACMGASIAAPAFAQSDNEIIVTAQKKEERLIDVPIAVTALTAEALDDLKIEGGAELLRAVPNVTFSKGNFSGYDFTIRGIGTKAISASSDPAVAVSFNNTPLIRNRLFEAEFFDLQRVEVLRGPQGTLYGRNATAGVVNMLPALPEYQFKGELKAEIGNFDTRRLTAMINVPLSDTFAIRAAGTLTKRDGFDYNTFTKKRVNDRDLWSTRVIAQWEPSDRFKVNAIWQHFEEGDQRSRTGKQLCTRDPGKTVIGTTAVPLGLESRFSQGCMSASLYTDEAYGVPNGSSLPFIYFLQGNLSDYDAATGERIFPITPNIDPFAGVTQSKNLREIATSYDPVFRANNDFLQLNAEFEVSDGLTIISQTGYSSDRYFSSQDYGRFVSNPIFNATDDILGNTLPGPAPGGIYTDPQLGPSSRMLAVDLSRSTNSQWTQEFRIQSAFDGPLNFNIGANYLNFKSKDDYFVYNNMFSYIAEYFYNRDIFLEGEQGKATLNCEADQFRECMWVDYNPIGVGPEDGHNYFRSKNDVKTVSKAIFGELYWNVAEDVKVTVGARYTSDKKTATPYPSQLLLASVPAENLSGPASGGRIYRGYRALPDIKQTWDELTGRLVLDWKPDTAFSDMTLLYAAAAYGYKGGGANPPRADLDPLVVQYQPLAEIFKPEYVTSFEVGAKNSFMGGRLTLNATAFLNIYKDYQISQIVDRISLNENFDAKTWGAELEAVWRPTPNLRFDGNLGYLRTRVGSGAQSIDVMNRTQSDPDWVTLRPHVQVPSNCVAPKSHVETILSSASPIAGITREWALMSLCSGTLRYGTFDPTFPANSFIFEHYNIYGFEYNPLVDAPNGGRGFYADLEGNELPNAPRMTFNIGGQYTLNINEWNLTLRGDYYRQSASYARIFNTEYDRLRSWENANISVTLDRPTSGLTIQLYVKNVFNKTPITNTFTNSDDSGLSTNVFTLDPRIWGLSISNKF